MNEKSINLLLKCADLFISASKVLHGYKVMQLNGDELVSLANNHFKIPAKINHTIEFPGKGLYLGLDKKFVLDYYSGSSDEPEALVTVKFNLSDVVTGNIEDKESVVSVSKAVIVNIEELND